MKADLRKAPVALEGDILTKKRIARVSQNILSQDAWFHTANELIEAMKFLEPHIESYWKAFNAQFPGQDCEPEPEHSLTKVHMMLAGFAIENLCKGYLVDRLSTEDQNAVGAGRLPKSLRTHDTLELIEMTGMTLSGTEKFLVQQIDQAIWRGRYPSPTSYEAIRPFAEGGSDVRRITALLRRLRGHVGAKKS